jgi:hypothetical protein
LDRGLPRFGQTIFRLKNLTRSLATAVQTGLKHLITPFSFALLFLASGCALSGNSALKRLLPTQPQSPSSDLHNVLRVTLDETLKINQKVLKQVNKQSKVVILADSDYITPEILPTNSARAFSILAPEDVTEIADWNGDILYLRLELRTLAEREAKVLFEVVGTQRHCCKNAQRNSGMATVRLQQDGWHLANLEPFTNPFYNKPGAY